MDMYDIEKKMEMELDEERSNFAKDFLKRKRLELDRLDEEIGKLADRLEKAEEEYDDFLGMTVDEVYDKYKPKSFITLEYSDTIHGLAPITGSFSYKFQED